MIRDHAAELTALSLTPKQLAGVCSVALSLWGLGFDAGSEHGHFADGYNAGLAQGWRDGVQEERAVWRQWADRYIAPTVQPGEDRDGASSVLDDLMAVAQSIGRISALDVPLTEVLRAAGEHRRAVQLQRDIDTARAAWMVTVKRGADLFDLPRRRATPAEPLGESA